MTNREHSDGPAERLPSSLVLAFDASVLFEEGADKSTVLVGGSPLRLLRLRGRAKALVERWHKGEPVRAGSSPGVVALARRLLQAGMAHPRWADADTGPHLADVTVVIPVHQRRAALERLLTSLDDLRRDCVAEVIVVDDGSTDGSGELAAAWGARVIRRPDPSGPAAARNAGLAEVRSSHVAFLDSDCETTPAWLPPLLAHFCDPTTAVVAPRIRSAGNGTAVERYEAVRSALDLGPVEGRVAAGTRVSYVPSAALVCRVDAVRLLDGFDETMPVGEDVDLLWRMTQAKGEIRYEPASVVFHHDRTTLAELSNRRYAYGTSAAALHLRHPGQVPPLVLSPWSLAAWVCALGLTPASAVIGIGIAAGSAARLPRKLSMLTNNKQIGWRLATRGHWHSGEQLGAAAWRSYLPVVAVLATRSRRARAMLAIGLLSNVGEWRVRRPALDPLRYVGLRVIDDASYCAGVWAGCIRQRTIGPLVPKFPYWPGRRSPTEDVS